MPVIELFRNSRPDAPRITAPQYTILLTACNKDDRGNPLLTKRCAGLQELSTEIDALTAQLNRIKKEAHEKWESADKAFGVV